MSDRTILITESDGRYKIENKGFSDLELIGMLECALFDLKQTSRQHIESPVKDETLNQETESLENSPPTEEVRGETVKDATTPDIRTRIKNAVSAIKKLGGEATVPDMSKMSEAELETEFEELTNQYKRLKKTKENAKK